VPNRDPEKSRAYSRLYREKNREACLERNRIYREKNREACLEQGRIYRDKNREKRRESNRATYRRWYEKNRHKDRERCRLYREKNLETLRLYREKRRDKRIDHHRARYDRLRDLSRSLGTTFRSAVVLLAIEKLKKEIGLMSPRQDAPPSKLAGANRTNLGKGLHPGGKPSPSARVREAQQLVVSEEFGIAEDVIGESAPSARILARGVSNHGDMQAFLEALALDVVHGRVDHKTANFLLQTIRTRVGLWVQAQTFGAKLDIAPYREVDAKQIPSEATDSQ
jgi:hypothetical protein